MNHNRKLQRLFQIWMLPQVEKRRMMCLSPPVNYLAAFFMVWERMVNKFLRLQHFQRLRHRRTIVPSFIYANYPHGAGKSFCQSYGNAPCMVKCRCSGKERDFLSNSSGCVKERIALRPLINDFQRKMAKFCS